MLLQGEHHLHRQNVGHMKAKDRLQGPKLARLERTNESLAIDKDQLTVEVEEYKEMKQQADSEIDHLYERIGKLQGARKIIADQHIQTPRSLLYSTDRCRCLENGSLADKPRMSVGMEVIQSGIHVSKRRHDGNGDTASGEPKRSRTSRTDGLGSP